MQLHNMCGNVMFSILKLLKLCYDVLTIPMTISTSLARFSMINYPRTDVEHYNVNCLNFYTIQSHFEVSVACTIISIHPITKSGILACVF